MKVICDNCRAVYKIPDEKLVKPVNKATCRQCSHRMLIPRPRKGADPDERTLVTAVPHTPALAPPREAGDPVTRPIEDDPEHTLPSQSAPTEIQTYDDDLLLPSGTPETADEHDVEPADLTAPSPTPDKVAPPHPYSQSEGIAPPLAPPPPPPHDPAPDFTLAALGSLGAMAGLVILAMVALAGAAIPMLYALAAVAAGLMIGAGGALVSMLAVLTSRRGRRPGKRVLSVIAGTTLAAMLSVGLVVVRLAIDNAPSLSATFEQMQANLDEPIDPADLAPATLDAEPLQADTDPPQVDTDAPPLDTDAPQADDATTADEPASAEPTATTASPAATTTSSPTATSSRTRVRPASTRSPTSRSTATPTPKPTAKNDEMDLSDDALAADPAPASRSLPRKPSSAAVEILLTNSVEVKKCFFKEQRAAGSLPPKVEVKFTIRPNGSATSVGVKQAKYAGTDLDFCLAKAVKGITFPPSTEGMTLTFPFVLQ